MSKRRTQAVRPSFFSQVTRAFTLFGSSDSVVPDELIFSGPAVDARSLRGDWVRVGTDLRTAMEKTRGVQVQ